MVFQEWSPGVPSAGVATHGERRVTIVGDPTPRGARRAPGVPLMLVIVIVIVIVMLVIVMLLREEPRTH